MAKSLIILIMVFMAIGSCLLGADQANAFTVKILALDTNNYDTQILAALSGVTFTEVSPADFLTIDLSAYDVLYVGSTFLDGSVTQPSQDALNSLYERRADIASFIASGHGLIALSEPIGENRYAWVPVTVTATYVYSSGYDVVNIIDPAHPVMKGLTDSGLSYWGSSYHTVFTDIGPLQTLALGIDAGSLPLTIAGTFGKGKMVLTGQDADWHYYHGRIAEQLNFMQNIVDWVAPKPKISGCLEMNGQPVVNTKVALKQDDAEKQETFTDSKGCYRFEEAVTGIPFKISIEGPIVK